MCTVTYIPVDNKTIITSNRDEKQWRLPAVAPALYAMRTGKILFPRDADAGGTWFATHMNGNVVVFLNGGMVRHKPKPQYRKSRGLVLIELVDGDSPYSNFLDCDLRNIQPFTAIIFEQGRLFECRWDGENKKHAELNKDQPCIWSSVTLYDDKVIRKRKKWFEEWLEKNPSPSQEDILHFHQFTGDGDKHNDLLMNRNGHVFTVSITSIQIDKDAALMQYLDFKNQQTHHQQIAFTKATVSR
jgi:hypothetical protein